MRGKYNISETNKNASISKYYKLPILDWKQLYISNVN
jgi:hypothetical protein